jgi:hypothetical protein
MNITSVRTRRFTLPVLMVLLTACPGNRGAVTPAPETGRTVALQPFAGRWAIFREDSATTRSWIGKAQQPMPDFYTMTLTQLRKAVAQQFGLSIEELSEPIVTLQEGGKRHIEFRQRTGSRAIIDAGIFMQFESDGTLAYLRESFLPSSPSPPMPALPANLNAFVRSAVGTVIPAEGGVMYVREVGAPFLYSHHGQARWAIEAYIEVVIDAEMVPIPYDVIVALASGDDVLDVIEHLHPQAAGPEANVFRPTPLVKCTSAEYATVAPSPTHHKVELLRLDSGTTVVNGAYAEFKNLDGLANPPWSACNSSGACDYHFKWFDSTDALQQRKFSEVMAYFHIDDVQHYVQNDVGLVLPVNRPIAVDTVAKAGTLFAFYLHKPAAKQGLYFGVKNLHSVATDGKAIVHEYAHALQAAVVGGRLSKKGDPSGIREGFADYLAVSMFSGRESAECRPCVGTFMNGGDCLRSLLNAQKYPPVILPNDPHERGLVWGRALFRVLETLQSTSSWDAARRIVDRGAFLGHAKVGTTTKTPNMPDMARATLAAVRSDPQTSAHFDAFCDGFEQQEILKSGDCAAMKTLPVIVAPLPP